MANEDFTTYTEVDPNSRITVTAPKVAFSGLRNNDSPSYVYKDFGASYFTGNFSIKFEFQLDSFVNGMNELELCVLSDSVGAFNDIKTANGNMFIAGLAGGASAAIYVEEVDGGAYYASAGYTISTSTLYYCTLRRDGSVGTYGTLHLEVYSDSGRTTLLSSQSVALHTSVKNLRYGYGVQNDDAGSTQSGTGFTQNFNISFLTSVTSPLANVNIQGLVSTLKVSLTSALANLNIQALVPTLRIMGFTPTNRAKHSVTSVTNRSKNASSASNRSKSSTSSVTNLNKS